MDHPLVEADRLGDTPPARAMRAVSAHAKKVLPQIRGLAKERDMVGVEGGKGVGAAFSVIRDGVGDLLLTLEKSYRATLLGMHHGIGVVELIRHVATSQGDGTLVAWCGRWLETRRRLVEAAERELEWFGTHPDRAVAPAKSGSLANGVRALVHGVENVAEKIRSLVPTARVVPVESDKVESRREESN